MKIIEWFKHLFRIKTVTDEELNVEMERSRQKLDPKNVQREIDDTDKELVAIGKRIETLKREALELARPRDIRGIRKQLKIEAIAEKNLERQRSTLGYGLKSKFFKPRPAYEKKNWRLDKKPDDD